MAVVARARLLMALLPIIVSTPSIAYATTVACRTWEKVEIVLQARNAYGNPYRDVTVWVDLKGPDSERRCYGFWDGGDSGVHADLAVDGPQADVADL